MNGWFYETFLPSIFERCEAGKEKWLSQKQTAICVQNMARHQVRFDTDGYGTMGTHYNYTCQWNGRSVCLFYSKKNGCGRITFGFSAEEQAKINAENELERKRIMGDRVARIKRNPERLANTIESLVQKLENAKANYQDDVAEKLDKYIEGDLKFIAEIEAELALYTN